MMQKLKNLKLFVLSTSLLFATLAPVLTPAPIVAENCGGVKIAISVECQANKDENPIFAYLRAIIRFVSAGVGLGLVLAIIIAGIRWTISQGNPQAVAAAVKLLINSVVGLILFILLFAILNFVIPGRLIG